MNWDKFSIKIDESKKKTKLDPVGKEDLDINNDNVVDDSDSYLKKRREAISKNIAVKKESLDPVGKEDEDIDNDGKKNTKSDKYLMNRRRVRNKIITSKVSESCDSGEKCSKCGKSPCECSDIDSREMKTKVNLVKNKLRSMGLKMSYEPEGEIVEARKKKDDSYLETNMKKRRENNEKAVEDMKKVKDDTVPRWMQETSEHEIEEGMSLKDFKANRRKIKRQEASADAEKRGHVGKEWHNTGRKYSADEAKSRRSKMSDDERAARHRSAVDPDDDRDTNYYSADKTKNPKKIRKQKAMGEEFQTWVESLIEEGYDLSDFTWEEMYDIYEGEGSYGKTPKAREAMGKLAIARRSKPASEYSQKGEKTKKVKEIEKHTRRIDNGPDVGNRGKKSTKPRYSGMLGKSGRGKLDQDARDHARDSAVEYTAGGHKPGPGTVTKNPKKLRKQKAMGEGYLTEKSLSRAQQRFMGMVYAAKKGETPASPEVAKAAEGMSKKAAKDFAKTKHEGLPEKKEEVSLLQLMISTYSPLSEGKLDDLLKSIRDEDDDDSDSNEDQKKRVLKKKKEQSSSASPKRGKGASSSRERQVVASGATRVKAKAIEAKGKTKVAEIEARSKSDVEKAKTEREKMKGERQEKAREYKQQEKAERAVARAKKDSELRKSKSISDRIKKADEEEASKKRTKEEIKASVKGAVKGMKTRTFSHTDGDGKAAAAVAGNIGQIGTAALKAGKGTAKALLKARAEKKEKERKEKRNEQIRKEEESKNESFSNWRESFLIEIDDQSQEDKKIIDVMPKKKKNNIEISPKLDEAAPVVVGGVLARALGGTVARGVGARLAGGAASGTLRKKASEFIGKKAGEMTAKKVDDIMQKKKKSAEDGDGETVLGQMASIGEDWQSVNRKDKTDGLSQKAVDAYRRENPGSKLQTAVTEKKPTGKRAERRKSFCRRMSGMKKRLTSAETARDPDSRINKALRRWNCN